MAFFQMLAAVLFICVSVHASPRYVSRKTSFPYTFYTRAEWRALPPTDTQPFKLPVPYVVIHHTYIPAACLNFKDCAAKMRSMQTYHNSMAWGDIGYNFCVGSEAGVYEGRGWDTVGIHAKTANSHSIGICLIGDWRVELPPQDQLKATKALIAEGVRLGKISPNYKLVGHNQAVATECPGEALLAEISTWDHFAPGKPDFTNFTVTTTAATM